MGFGHSSNHNQNLINQLGTNWTRRSKPPLFVSRDFSKISTVPFIGDIQNLLSTHSEDKMCILINIIDVSQVGRENETKKSCVLRATPPYPLKNPSGCLEIEERAEPLLAAC